MVLVTVAFAILALFFNTINGGPKCGQNEEWVPRCASGCEISCDNIEPILCYKKCFPPQCQCSKNGDFRRNKDGKCVLSSECT